MTGPGDTRKTPLDRDRLAKVLALLASPADGEALAAARMVVKLLAAHDMRPEQLVYGLPNPDPFGLASFVYTRPPAPPASSVNDPFRKPAEYYARHRRPKPSATSFRDIGPGEARERLRAMLATPLLPKPRAFVVAILERLREPHKAALMPAEIRKLDAMWRLVQEVAAAFSDRAAS